MGGDDDKSLLVICNQLQCLYITRILIPMLLDENTGIKQGTTGDLSMALNNKRTRTEEIWHALPLDNNHRQVIVHSSSN